MVILSIEPGSFCTCVYTHEVVCRVTFGPWLPRVCKASQTSAAMMISGKSALRKKRFTELCAEGTSGHAGLTHFLGGELRPGGDQRGVENAHIGQIPVPLAEIEPVADHEPVRDLEADIAHRHVD